MDKYQVTGPSVNVNAGCVLLSADQVRRRRHNLKAVGDDVFEIVNPIQFKHGETFGYDGPVDHITAEMVSRVGEDGAAEEVHTSGAEPVGIDLTDRQVVKDELTARGVSFNPMSKTAQSPQRF